MEELAFKEGGEEGGVQPVQEQDQLLGEFKTLDDSGSHL